MNAIRHKETLFFYDCVQVFSSIDFIGANYLSVLVESGVEKDKYLTFGIAPEKLRDFKKGNIDLRQLIIDRPIQDWYLIEVEGDFSIDLNLEKQTHPISEEMLPVEGFLLKATPLTADLVTREARERNNVIFEIWIDPPEAAASSKIHANTLAALLSNVQTLVKHSYNKALSKLSAEARKNMDFTNASVLDTFAFAPGSFKVLFESARGADLFGFIELRRAMEKLDEITDHADAPSAALEIMKTNRGHIVSAYIRLLDFLIKHDTGFSYKWSDPLLDQPSGRTITVKQAGPLYEALSRADQLGVETVELCGYLRKADSRKNSWCLETEEDKEEFSGECKDSVTVSHLTIDSRYRFTCEERLEEQSSTGRETRTLLLVSFQQA